MSMAAQPDVVAVMLEFLDLPTQARCCRASAYFTPPQTLASVEDAAAAVVEHLGCPTCPLLQTALPTPSSASPARKFLHAAHLIWNLVAIPLLRLHECILECPGVLGDVIVRVYILGWRKRCRLTEAWWRRVIGRDDLPPSPAVLQRILRKRGMNENFLEAITDLNHPDPDVDLATAVLGEGAWSVHWFPVRFDDEPDELTDSHVVLTFDVHGVSGLIYFREVEMGSSGFT
ncbi:unnamed protein product [Durusdinium trenchii]|uniref:F-box domain-containing protein n=1 Tax=Durusdinium trenchii TaxID=1381693 RepID=A0ABP0LUE2_9DINO